MKLPNLHWTWFKEKPQIKIKALTAEEIKENLKNKENVPKPPRMRQDALGIMQ